MGPRGVARTPSASQTPRYIMCSKGFEPPTHGLEGRCSIQLSYEHTHDLHKSATIIIIQFIGLFKYEITFGNYREAYRQNMATENHRYDAFISYRHCELDSFVSENLHKKLESYKLPKSVIKKLSPEKTKIERVFRDEAELPLSDNLSDPITAALADAEFLIVICTPNLPKSQWCKKEIETFVEMHDRKHVLLVLADGEPEESFPEILTYEDVKCNDENGNDVTVRVEREPLAADCRGENNKQRLKAMDNAVLKLCAAMFNLNYDDLKQRHRERQIRRRLIAMSAVLAIVTVFALTCLFFTLKIVKQNKVIQDKYAGAMATASHDLLSQGLRLDSLFAVRSVLPDDPSDGYNKEAYKALVKAVAPYETTNSYFPSHSFTIPEELVGFSISEDGSYALLNCTDSFSVKDISSDTEIYSAKSEYSDIAIFNDTGVVYINDDLQVVHVDPESGKETLLADNGIDLYYVPGEKVTVVFTEDSIAGFRNLKEDFSIGLNECDADDPDYRVEDFYASEDGKYAAFALTLFDSSRACVMDVSAGKLKKCETIGTDGTVAVSCDNTNLYVCFEKDDFNITGVETDEMDVISIGAGPTRSTDLPGRGFYDLKMCDSGILVISENLSYVITEDLQILSAITGYNDAVCAFPYEYGCVILDQTGQMFLDGIYSDDKKSFNLYGHDNSPFIGSAAYNDDTLFIRYIGAERIVVYEPLKAPIAPMQDIGNAIPLEEGGTDSKSIHLKKANVHIMDNKVFDDDFNMISELPHGMIVATGEDGKSVVIQSPYSFDIYYNVKILSYDEMIKAADELLGDHVPDRSICDKYSMTYTEE